MKGHLLHLVLLDADDPPINPYQRSQSRDLIRRDPLLLSCLIPRPFLPFKIPARVCFEALLVQVLDRWHWRGSPPLTHASDFV